MKKNLSHDFREKQGEMFSSLTEGRIHKYHRQTDTQSDFLGFLSQPKTTIISMMPPAEVVIIL